MLPLAQRTLIQSLQLERLYDDIDFIIVTIPAGAAD
jgi:hypothetical protein